MAQAQTGPTKFARALRVQTLSAGALLIAGTLALAAGVLALGARATLTSDHRASHAESLERAGALLAARVESSILSGDEARARRALLNAQVARVFRSCEVRADGGAIMDTGRTPTRDEAPERGSMITVTHPVELAEGRMGELIGRAPPLPEPRAAWSLELIAMVAFASAALLGVSGVVMRRQKLRALFAIRSSLNAYAAGEREEAALLVYGGHGDQARTYNAILHELMSADPARAEPGVDPAAPHESAASVGVDALGAIPHGIVIVDDAMRIQHINGAGGALLGLDPGSGAGVDLSRVCPGDGDGIVVLVRGVVAPDAPRRQSGEIVMDEGRTVLRATAIRVHAEGGTVAAVVLLEDITQQRHSDEMLNSFIAQATHELRTPLTNIRMYAEEAVDAGAEDEAFRSNAFNMINTESRRLERLITDMLSVSELEAGSMQLRADLVHPDRIFEELERDYGPQAEGKSIKLHFDLPPKFPSIMADRDKLAQAVHNLVGNALKYTPEGGSVTVSCAFDADEAMTVKVTDTGIGISPEDQTRIFERFCRASDQRVESISGTGLGLSISREIARLHGGDLTLESQLDHGSTFTLRVPSGSGELTARAA